MELFVFEVHMFHENTELLPSDDSYEISMGDDNINEGITTFLVGISINNQLVWVKVVNK